MRKWMLNPNSLVGELRLGKTRKLDKGCTEKEAAHSLWAITGAAAAHASFWDTPHSANVQKVLEEYISQWSELASALTAAAVMLTWLQGKGAEVLQNNPSKQGNARSWEWSNVPAKLTELQKELIVDILTLEFSGKWNHNFIRVVISTLYHI